MIEELAPRSVDPALKESSAATAPVSNEQGAEKPNTGSRPSETEKAMRLDLLDATRAAIGRAAQDLARGFARRSGPSSGRLELSEGHLLGAAAAMRYAGVLRATLGGRPAMVEHRGVKRGRLPAFEHLASPGLNVRVLGRTSALEAPNVNTGDTSIILCDADAPSILLNLALHELFVRGRRPIIIAPEPSFEVLKLALRPLLDDGVASVERGGASEAIAAAEGVSPSRIVAVCSPASRAALRGSSGDGREIGGFSSHGPSLIAIAPFLYGRDELAVLAAHVAIELVAPPGPTRGVRLVLARGWLQRSVLLELLRRELGRRAPRGTGGDEQARLAELAERAHVRMNGDDAPWLVIEEEGSGPAATSGLRVVTVVERGSDEGDSFLDALARELDDLSNTSEEEAPIHLVSIFAHPMLLERPTFVNALERWNESHASRVVGLGTRASMAWSLGGPPVGPRRARIQNGWMLDEAGSIVVEAPLRRSLPMSRASIERRARFEGAPSLATALMLGARSLILL